MTYNFNPHYTASTNKLSVRHLFCPYAFSQNPLPFPNAKRFPAVITLHTSSRCLLLYESGKLNPKMVKVLSKCTLQSARVSPSPSPSRDPYVLFRRGLSSRSYDLLFDNSIPYYSLEQMIREGKIQYDYPVYWKKLDDIEENTTTRSGKKDKVLKDLSEKYAYQ